MQVKQWEVALQNPEIYSKLRDSTSLSDLACRVLSTGSRGASVEEINQLLFQQMEFEPPFALKDMDKATQRIHTALDNEEKIAIYGDYDCDGITSTAMLMSYFTAFGANVFYYIPSREQEGYGLNKAAIEAIHSQGAQLIITVDNGISAHEEIDFANSLGLEVIVTDHHTPRATLPNCVAVVNPHRTDCTSRFKDYAGVGVAFQLLCALEQADPLEMLEFYSDFVTIGTIADLMPLVKENRVIVQHGLELLGHSTRPGIQALLQVGGLTPPFSVETVSFGLAPRLNAAGRMDRTDLAMDLLLTEDEKYGQELAAQLQDLNIQRRNIEEQVIIQIMEQLKNEPEKLLDRLLIVSGENWHQGVLGIVASRLTKRFGKPCIIFSVTNGEAKGSGRSMDGFSLIKAISHCSSHLTHYGGHTLAAGLTLMEENLASFYTEIQAYAKENYPIMPVASYNIDTPLTMEDLRVENIQSLNALAPFGTGNPSPLYILEELELVEIVPTGDHKHLRLRFQKAGLDVWCIYFSMPPTRFPYKVGQLLNIVVDVELNQWNGSLSLSTKIQDIRPFNYPEGAGIIESQRYFCHVRREYGDFCDKKDLLPSQEELGVIYRYLRSNKGYAYGPVPLWEELISSGIPLDKLQVSLDAFEEAGLIKREGSLIKMVSIKEKVNLQDTETLKALK